MYHKFTLGPIPRKSPGKMYKKPGHNIVFPNVPHYCMDPFQAKPMGKCPKKPGGKFTKVITY
jgi:hypothetical protein